jgi:hypothetical protein
MEKAPPTIRYSDPLERLREMDWDYAGDQSDSRFSSLHFYPGRLISQIPAALIGTLSKAGDWILDPYCGSGTTVLEAQRLGRPAVGIDINPVAILIGRAKSLSVCSARLRKVLSAHLQRILNERLTSGSTDVINRYYVPESVQGAKWYHPATLFELSLLWNYIDSCSGIVRHVLEFCFSSTLVPACSETRHWGYICDNTRPLTARYESAFKLFETAIEDLCTAYEERDRRLKSAQTLPRVKFECGDAAHMLRQYPAEQFGLVVCSPPYFGVIDYVKAQRLTMEWFGQDIQDFRQLETGARSKRHRLRAFDEYISDVKATFVEVARTLRSGAYCCVILGQSAKRRETIPELIQTLTEAGLEMQLQLARDVAVRRRQQPHIGEETLLIFRKP